VIAKLGHGACFTLKTSLARNIQAIGLDQGESDIAPQPGVMGEVDALLAAFAEEPSDLVSATGEGRGGRRWCYWTSGWGCIRE
jgi:hypothetical protein